MSASHLCGRKNGHNCFESSINSLLWQNLYERKINLPTWRFGAQAGMGHHRRIPTTAQNVLNFMHYFEKFGKIVYWRPLDPPLAGFTRLKFDYIKMKIRCCNSCFLWILHAPIEELRNIVYEV